MISFFVPGDPRPRGSKRGFIFQRKTPRKGKWGTLGVAQVDMSKGSKEWMDTIKKHALAAMKKDAAQCMIGPVRLEISFFIKRPASHYLKSGELREGAPRRHIGRPDRLKLARAVEDALTGVVYEDDAQIIAGNVTKDYCDQGPGVYITARPTGI